MSAYNGPRTAFDPSFCAMLIEHMGKGFSYETFSAKIGTCRATLYNWEKDNPEWLDAKKTAQELCQYWWEAAGIEGLYTIYGRDENGNREVIEKAINPSLWIFNMKARFRWKDAEVKGPEQIEEREVLSLEDKKRLLNQGEAELKRLKEEIAKEDK